MIHGSTGNIATNGWGLRWPINHSDKRSAPKLQVCQGRSTPYIGDGHTTSWWPSPTTGKQWEFRPQHKWWFFKSRTNYLTCQTWNLPPKYLKPPSLETAMLHSNDLNYSLCIRLKTTPEISRYFFPETFSHHSKITNTSTLKTKKQQHKHTNNSTTKYPSHFCPTSFQGWKLKSNNSKPLSSSTPTSCHAASFGTTALSFLQFGMQRDAEEIADWFPDCSTFVRGNQNDPEKKHSVWSTWNKDDLLDGQMICKCVYIYVNEKWYLYKYK